jgi:predicted permease
LIKLLSFFFRQSSRLAASAIVIGAIGGASGALLMALLSARLDPDREASAATSGWSFIGVVVLILVSGYLSRVQMIHLSEKTTFELRMKLCRQVVATSLRTFEQTGMSRILAVLTQDINNLTNALINFPAACINLAILTGCLIYLGWLSPTLLILVVVLVGLSALSIKVPQRAAAQIMRRARQDWDDLVKHFHALTGGIKELKLNSSRRRAFFSSQLERTAESYRRHNFTSFHIHAATNSWGQILYFVAIGILLYIFADMAEVDHRVLVAYTVTCLYMRGPLVALLDAGPTFSRARVSLQKIEDLGLCLSRSGEDAEQPLLPGARQSFQRIELIDVAHSYYREREESEFTLGPINLTLRAGELIFLVGGNGSGKTTLAKLLTGLYSPEAGQIRLDGRLIEDRDREWYRQYFSALFTDFHLFESLSGLTSSGETFDDRVQHYLVELQLDHKVRVEDGVLSTTSLSQGQRKRLALLSAYLEDRPVYLFDEWAADQDPQFKEIFYTVLLPDLKARGKAVFVISHDDRYYGLADRLLKLEHGKLVEGADLPAVAQVAEPRTDGAAGPAVASPGMVPFTPTSESARDASRRRGTEIGGFPLSNTWNDLRYGLRTLMKSPGFTIVAVLTLALGIGTNAAFFSILDAVLLRPYPYKDPERLGVVRMVNAEGGADDVPLAYPDYVNLRARNSSFEDLAAITYSRVNITGGDRPVRVRGVRVSANLFPILGTETVLGRTFLPEEERPGAGQVAVLSELFWRTYFEADPGIVGRTVRIDGEPRTVVGVVASQTQLPAPNDAQIFLPLALDPATAPRDELNSFVIGRLKPNVTLERAGTEAGEIVSQSAREHPDRVGWSARAISLRESRTGEDRPFLLIGLASACFVLLIACANVANLLLQRGAVRQRDLAVRMALGASRWQLVRQLLAESVLLALLAAGAGLLLSQWMLRLTVSLMPADDLPPYMNNFSLDVRGLIYLLGISIVTVLISGLIPTLRVSRISLTESLGGSGTKSSGGVRQPLRSALVVAEISLSMVLLIVAGLLVTSFRNMLQVDFGFDRENTLALEVAVPESEYPQESQRAALYRDVMDAVRAVPGVTGVGTGDNLPFGGWRGTTVLVEGQAATAQENNPRLGMQVIAGDYFESLGQPLVAGREFAEQDDGDALRVAILNRRAVQAFWPHESPLGKRIQLAELDPGSWFTVVGVVGDIKRRGLDDNRSLDVYLPAAQVGWGDMRVFMRTRSAPLSMVSTLRSTVGKVAPNLPVDDIRPLGTIIEEEFTAQRISGTLSGLFAAFALLMAMVGIYGAISYSVSQRTHEIGIRMALGARRSDIIRLVVGQVLVLALIGIVLGLGGAFALSRVMSALLFGVSAGDLAIFTGVALLLVGIALLASYVPAQRASRVHPVASLRAE